MAFINKTPQPMKGTREYYEKNYNVCRANLLAVIAFTVVSVITLFLNDSYFLFSHYAAVELLTLGIMLLGGKWTEWEDAADWAEMGQDAVNFSGAIALAVGIVILVALGICWLFSKKSRIPMIVAAVIMAIDTVYVILMIDIVNILFHAWIMYYLISAIRDWGKLQALPEDDGMIFEGGEQSFTVTEANMNNPYGAPMDISGDSAAKSTEATENNNNSAEE